VGGLRSITQTCRPRDDVLDGGLADNHFAAQLDLVVNRPEGYPVYGDADAFFALTYPTEGLKWLLRSTCARESELIPSGRWQPPRLDLPAPRRHGVVGQRRCWPLASGQQRPVRPGDECFAATRA